jgi:Carboxypeptidase regulatory-like domain
MRPLAIAICLCLFSFAAFGQAGLGSITGTVMSPAHAPAPAIKVEAKNVETGTFYKTVTSPKGEYTFAQLPAGTYEVSVLGRAYGPFVRKGVAVGAGGSQRLDIQLTVGSTLDTLGELGAYLALATKRPPPPEGPTPRTPDGKPDFSGVWMTPPSYAMPLVLSPPVDLLPWAEALVRERLLNNDRDAPSARCLSNSQELIGLLPLKYIQTRTLLVELMEDVPAAHQVFLDGRTHPNDLEPTWRGHSIGTWDGDTLVIDTVGFNNKMWLFNLIPQTEMLHVTQRLRRPDLGHLEIETTYDDPGAFKAPAKFKIVNVLAPDEEVQEVVCENNQYTEHVK